MDSLVSSSLTKLVWLVLAAWVISKVAKEKTSGVFWAGYALASVAILAVMTTRTNPVNGDAVFSDDLDGDGEGGTLNDYAIESAGNPGSVKKPLDW